MVSCAFRLPPAVSGSGVRRGRACWARVSAVPHPSWLGCRGVFSAFFFCGGSCWVSLSRALWSVPLSPFFRAGLLAFFFFVVFVSMFRCPFSRWAAVPGLVLPVLAGWSPCASLGVLSSVPSGWGVWLFFVLLAGSLVAVGCYRAPPPPCFFFEGGGPACSSLCLPWAGARTVAGVWCGWSLATPGGGSCVLLRATPGWVSLLVVVGVSRHSWLRVPVAVPRHSWLGSAGGGGVWCAAVVCWWGCRWCVVWLVPRHSWRRFLCATPGHSWLGFAAGGGAQSTPLLAEGPGCGSPPLLAGVRWRRWCVVCGVWCVLCGGGVLVGLWLVCGLVGPSPLLAEVPVCYSPPFLAGFRCRWWCAVLATPGGGSRARFPATPRWVSLSAVLCGVWCVVCSVRRWCVGGVVPGVWCGWSLATPGRGSCVLLPPLLAGFRCRWWCVVLATPRCGSRARFPATPGWGPMAAVVCGVWCVAVVCWWGCCWCVVWLVPRHSWRRFLCATPRHSWLGFAAGGGGRFSPLLAEGPGCGSPPLLAGVRWRRWCVVCGGGVLVGLSLVCGVVGPSPILAEVPVCYSRPLLAGFRCRWWCAVHATPG